MRRILMDSGILFSYYQQQEPFHLAVVACFDQTGAQLITLCSEAGSARQWLEAGSPAPAAGGGTGRPVCGVERPGEWIRGLGQAHQQLLAIAGGAHRSGPLIFSIKATRRRDLVPCGSQTGEHVYGLRASAENHCNHNRSHSLSP